MFEELGENGHQRTGGRGAVADLLERCKPPISAAGALEIAEATLHPGHHTEVSRGPVAAGNRNGRVHMGLKDPLKLGAGKRGSAHR